jgi:hypothetical protein
MARIQDPIVTTLRALARKDCARGNPEGLASIALESASAIESFTPDLESVREAYAESDPLTRARAMLAAANHSSNARLALASMSKRATVALAEHAATVPDHLLGLVDAGLSLKVQAIVKREEREIRLRTEAKTKGMTYEAYMNARRDAMKARRMSRLSPERQAKRQKQDVQRAAMLKIRAEAQQDARENQERIAKVTQDLEWQLEEVRIRREALRIAQEAQAV